MKTRHWTSEKLIHAVLMSKSVRQTIQKLGLIPAGGNYTTIKNEILELGLDITHFTGKGWRRNSNIPVIKAKSLSTVLTLNSNVQSYKLKKRLFREGVKKPTCEECGWAKVSSDGRLPLELDHINGKKTDNRIENLRILCPNCHSLKPTHRGKNKRRPGGEMVYT